MLPEKVTICICASRNIIDADKAAELAARLSAGGCSVALEPDLCEKVQNASPEAMSAASGVVAACYPRAVRSLFDTLGVSPKGVVDIRNGSVESVCGELGLDTLPLDSVAKACFTEKIAAMRAPESAESPESPERAESAGNADAWFPVIDKTKCSECGKCNDFCLFHVYSTDEGGTVVRNPRNCKNNCPACARVCPSGAIIFPKYGKSPINGGLDNEERAFALDTSALYNEALREKLMQRRAGIPLFKKG